MNLIIFALTCANVSFRLHSSMDRISDSGSDDMGSSPVAVTVAFDGLLPLLSIPRGL